MFVRDNDTFDTRMAMERGYAKPFTGWYGWYNWANIFTFARVPAAVYATYLYDQTYVWWGIGVLIFAALTDLIDGKLARWTGRDSKLGAMADPAADYGMIAWVGFWMWSNNLARPAVIMLAAVMLYIAVQSSRHSAANDGVAGTSMNAKWGMTFRSAGLGSFILGDAISGTTATEVAGVVGYALIVLGIVFGLVGLSDFKKRTA